MLWTQRLFMVLVHSGMAWPPQYDASATYDEMVDDAGRAREGSVHVHARLEALGVNLFERQRAAEAAIRSMGVTFTLYTEAGKIDRAWPMDAIPRIIPSNEWAEITAGLIQRLKAINMFIDDLYNGQQILADGVVPASLLANSENFRPQFRGISPKNGVWAHISGSDLVRDATGQMYVLEDNLRIPSGVSYMLKNRDVSKRVLADLFRDLDVLPLDGYSDHLASMLASLSPRGDSVTPVVCILTPGVHNSAYYEHVLLSTTTGSHLVEGSDLVVENDIVYMRTVGGLVRVDVIYRRVDDLWLDPDLFEPSSTLGVPGLIGAWAAGNVAIANAPGAGVADDKVVYSYVPDIIEYYLDEKALLPNVPTWRCHEPDHRAHVLSNLESLVCKPANEAGGKGVTIGSACTAAELEAVRLEIEADPRNWIAQPILQLSTSPTICGESIAPRHVDLRPFILSGDEPYVTAGGLTRVALREGSLIVNSSMGGGSKDTWVVDPSVFPAETNNEIVQEQRQS